MTAGSAGKASRIARPWPVALIVAALLLALTGPFLGLLTSTLGVALLVLFIVSRRRWGAWFVPLVAWSVVVVLAGGTGPPPGAGPRSDGIQDGHCADVGPGSSLTEESGRGLGG